MSKNKVPQEWVKAKDIAPRMSLSVSTLYSLIRRGSTIPHVRLTSGVIVFNWGSIDKWLHEQEAKKRRANFEE
jgi:predicted DNA-binding transcriptional regulator AlpA